MIVASRTHSNINNSASSGLGVCRGGVVVRLSGALGRAFAGNDGWLAPGSGGVIVYSFREVRWLCGRHGASDVRTGRGWLAMKIYAGNSLGHF
jgi:hypothetical protein